MTQRVAVVTGGGTGVGAAVAVALGGDGWTVVTAGRRGAALRDLAAAHPGLALDPVPTDVTDEESVRALFATTVERLGRLDLLFNNAGIGGGGGFGDGSREEWERTFNVCWGGVYLGCRTFLPLMLEAEEGHIVNTSSVNGFWASLGPGVSHTAYPAAKFAV